MKIAHIAIWTRDLEGMRNFYLHYFDASSKEAYYNHTRDFKSYMIGFSGDCYLELMQMPGIPANKNDIRKQAIGFIHLAISVGSKIKVDEITQQLKEDGFRVLSEPRTTGDGFYESVILDPEGNRIELTV
ncbi:VOC family protein [Mangrovibacterium lignilyticum]|uniref:VOC family protein n=1 Tax=Mangrovibacterium lignilyticum TaxID=2668052 RepID=UPI0013D6EBF2|nr:VOC family protein [Mangrovibacterium lignilyticum]